METLRQWQFPTVHRPLGMAAQRHSDSYQRDTECIVFRKAGKALEAMAEWMSCARQSVSSVHDLLNVSFRKGATQVFLIIFTKAVTDEDLFSCSVCSCKFGQAIDAMIADQLRTKPDALHVFDSAAVEAGSRQWTN